MAILKLENFEEFNTKFSCSNTISHAMSTNFMSFIGNCERKEKQKYKRKGFYLNFLKIATNS